jgi:four helix bundle protein
MGAKSHEELHAWQLAVELRDEVLRETLRRPWKDDCRFRDQIREAASGVPSNIAEGFGRFQHADFARFLDFARGSLGELETRLGETVVRGLLTQPRLEHLLALANRTRRALVRLLKYLRGTDTPPF